MTGALKYEWVRIRTIASTYWLSGIAILLNAVVCFIIALSVTASNVDDLDVGQVTTWTWTAGASAPITPVLAGVFFAVMGVMAMGHEYRYGTNKATLSAIPDRIAVLAAKVVMLSLWVVGVVAVSLLLDLGITWLFLDGPDFEAAAWRPIVNYFGYCLGFALAGFGLAAILRSQVGALVAVLVWPLVLEPIAYGILNFIGESTNAGVGKLANLLPASAGRRAMFDPYDIFAGFGALDTWGIAASVVVFWAAVLGLVLAGSALFIKRDA
ncbi:MAG: hypothetical protein H0V02_03610 [Nocardioidaceae bacterium]|nr:hypothetical protein [Nocardioidaceae bacterium]